MHLRSQEVVALPRQAFQRQGTHDVLFRPVHLTACEESGDLLWGEYLRYRLPQLGDGALGSTERRACSLEVPVQLCLLPLEGAALLGEAGSSSALLLEGYGVPLTQN